MAVCCKGRKGCQPHVFTSVMRRNGVETIHCSYCWREKP